MSLSLCKAMVSLRSHHEYASVFWSILCREDKIILESIQQRATRLIPSLKGIPYSDRLKRLGLPTLEYRCKRADMVEVYRILNKNDLANKDKLFMMATYQQTRGHPSKLFKRCSRLNVHANSFSMWVIDTWNSLQIPSTV